MKEPNYTVSGQIRNGLFKYYGSFVATPQGIRVSTCMSSPIEIKKGEIIEFRPFHVVFHAGISIIHRNSELSHLLSIRMFGLEPAEIIRELHALGLGLPPDVVTAKVINEPSKPKN